MKFEIITIFPEIFRGVFEFGIIRRAVEAQDSVVRPVSNEQVSGRVNCNSLRCEESALRRPETFARKVGSPKHSVRRRAVGFVGRSVETEYAAISLVEHIKIS